jgi:DHA1 family inner membrane transport protein
MLLAIGFFGFARVPGLQMRVLAHASGAPTMASSANIAAFNVGNVLGVWVSGLAIGAGLGWTSPLWVGLLVLLAATRPVAQSAAAADRPAVRPLKRQPPRKVPSREL